MENSNRGAAPQANGERVFAAIATGRRGEELRIAFSQFKGRTFLAMRIWFEGDDGQMKPSGKGTNVKIAMLPAIASAINQAHEAAKSEGLV